MMTGQSTSTVTDSENTTDRPERAMSMKLQQGYEQLMARAPGAAFPRARQLYLNKYSFPQSQTSPDLRLFVCDEALEETIQECEKDDKSDRRIVTLTARPGSLALVHWQQSEPAEWNAIQHYLQETWEFSLNPADLCAQQELWFRDSGHQMRFQAPTSLVIQQRSLLSLKE